MEFEQVVRRRRMVRNFDPARPVPPPVVEKLLELAVRAPSAGVPQGGAFLGLSGAEDRERFWWAAAPPAGGPPPPWVAGMRRGPPVLGAPRARAGSLRRR